jgi:hypothetical protein
MPAVLPMVGCALGADARMVGMDWPGVESRESREALLRALARNVASWVGAAQQELAGDGPPDEAVREAVERLRRNLPDAEDQAALVSFMRWAMNGLTHSALVSLDGGSTDCPTMDVRDSDGLSLGDALHEEWPEFAPE